MVVQTCNPVSLEAGGTEAYGFLQFHSKFEASLGYVRLSYKQRLEVCSQTLLKNILVTLALLNQQK